MDKMNLQKSMVDWRKADEIRRNSSQGSFYIAI